MNRTLEIGGLDIKFRLSKVVSIPSDRHLIHFESLPNGSWRILGTQSLFPNLSSVTEFKVIRDGDDRFIELVSSVTEFKAIRDGDDPFIELVGPNQRIQITTSTCLRVRHNFIHMDEMAPNEWRLSYSSGLIPDFTKVTSLIIHTEEDVL